MARIVPRKRPVAAEEGDEDYPIHVRSSPPAPASKSKPDCDDGGLQIDPPDLDEILDCSFEDTHINEQPLSVLSSYTILPPPIVPANADGPPSELQPESIVANIPSPFSRTPATLDHIIAVTRLSDFWIEKTRRGEKTVKASTHELRREEMTERVIERHQRTHTGCDCKPSTETIMLNSVSSNTSTDTNADTDTTMDSYPAKRLEQIRQCLLTATNDAQDVDTTTVVAVCTADGLLTNVYSFIKLFAHFRDCAMYYYVFEEGEPQIFFLPALLNAVYAVYAVLNGSKSNSAESVLGKKRIRPAYTKLFQREANLAVRLEVSGVRRTTISLDETLSINNRYRFDASERVNRLVRSGRTLHRPHFVSHEEERVKLDFEQGMVLCPACPESDKQCPRHLPTKERSDCSPCQINLGFGGPEMPTLPV